MKLPSLFKSLGGSNFNFRLQNQSISDLDSWVSDLFMNHWNDEYKKVLIAAISRQIWRCRRSAVYECKDRDPILTYSQAWNILNEYLLVKGWSSNAVTQNINKVPVATVLKNGRHVKVIP